MNILLFGPPASGKGTQAKILAAKGYNHISTGEMLRAAVKAGTPLGNRIAALLAEGHLASDEIVNELVAERLRDGCDNCLFDGYPRTVPQAIFMDTLKVRVDLIVNLKVEDDVLLERIKGRFEAELCGVDPVAFMQRLDEYRSLTYPVMTYYARNLAPPMIAHIDGTRTVEDIAEQIDMVARTAPIPA